MFNTDTIFFFANVFDLWFVQYGHGEPEDTGSQLQTVSIITATASAASLPLLKSLN